MTDETPDDQLESTPWGDASTPEATEFFQETIASWSCRGCGTEFTIETVYELNRRLDRSVSCPMCGGDSVERCGGVE